MNSDTLQRKCSGACKQKFDLTTEFFHTRGKNKDGSIKFTADCKVYRRAYHKIYRQKNPHKFTTNPEVRKLDQQKYKEQYKVYWREWSRKKYLNDINFQISSNLRSRIWHTIQRNSKSAKTIELLGCSIQELKLYLESQFTEGMTWENYGTWHIDHIKPCASFNLIKEEEQKQCFHYTNLQPLWAVDNLIKGANYNGKNYKNVKNYYCSESSREKNT